MNILLIEDNENISDGLKYSLEKEKYHVMVCVSIEDTIKYLEKNNSIDFAVIDVSLPDGNGFDLYQKYIKDKNIPSIFFNC